MKIVSFLAVLLAFFIMACNNNDTSDNSNNAPQTPVLSYTIVAAYPHDTSSFTQGLAFYKGQLLEGTGNYGHSKLMQVDIQTGKPTKQVSLDSTLFGEGITVLNDTVYQLTWREKLVLVYSAKDFKKIKQFPLNTEGWGITNDGQNLIVSDGSNNLYFHEPSTFRLLRAQSVTENGSPSVNLNELEYINGFIYANQWQYANILKIDPNSGHVVGKMDLSDLVKRVQTKIPTVRTEDAAVLNGIAYDSTTNKTYITGKLWPEIYEIQFSH